MSAGIGLLFVAFAAGVVTGWAICVLYALNSQRTSGEPFRWLA